MAGLGEPGNMNACLRILGLALLGVLSLSATLCVAGGRIGGNAEIAYERLGPGGAAYASAGVYELGSSLGQGYIPYIATNESGAVFLNGFWKAEDACTLYNPTITSIVYTNTGQAGITFLVVNDNTYSVEYIDIEAGGLEAGVHVITNEVQTLVGVGGAGATTTVWHNVSSSTNRAKFYLIRCE